MDKHKFFKEVNKFKTHKVELGLIDDIFRDIDNLGWDDKLSSVYRKYEEARDFSDAIYNESLSTYNNLREQLDFLENALNELGVEPMGSVAEARTELDRIGRQIEGLQDDLNSGVLA